MLQGAQPHMLQGKNRASACVAVVRLYKTWSAQTSVSHAVRMLEDQGRGVCSSVSSWDFKPGFVAAVLIPVGTKLSLVGMPEFTNCCSLSGTATRSQGSSTERVLFLVRSKKQTNHDSQTTVCQLHFLD